MPSFSVHTGSACGEGFPSETFCQSHHLCCQTTLSINISVVPQWTEVPARLNKGKVTRSEVSGQREQLPPLNFLESLLSCTFYPSHTDG